MNTNNLKHELEIQGIENIRFMVPMKGNGTVSPLGLMVSSNSPDVMMKCKIVEDQYKVSQNYKISLTPDDREWYTEHFYVGDLEILIRQGIITIIPASEK